MRNTIILAVVLFVAVITASIYYFRNLDKEHNLAAKPLRFLPDNTLLIVSTHNNEISDNIFKDFEVFDALLGFNNVEQLAQFKTHILRNESFAKFVHDTEIYFSFHAMDNESEMMITIPTTTAITPTELPTVLHKIAERYRISNIDTLGNTLYNLAYGDNDSSMYALYHEHTIFVAASQQLLIKIIDKNTRHLSDDQIDFFLKSSSRNTPLSVYFPHQQFDSMANLYQRRGNGVFLNLFQKLHGQSAWNINFRQDALMLTGESEVDQYSENYISLFKHQQKTTQYLYNHFPANTAVYMEYSISDRSRFQKDLKDLFKRRREKIAQEVDTTDLSRRLSEALGDEFAFVETANQNYIGFIRIGDSTVWSALQSQLLESTSDTISRFKSSNVLYKHYGDAFKEFPRPYLTTIDSIIVVANSGNTLRAYRSDWSRRNLLIGTLGFQNFEKLQGNEANVTFFVHTRNANSKIINSLTPHFQRNFRDKENYGFHDFYSWSAQLSGNNGKFSSQLYAVYKSKNALGVTPEWTYDFEDRAITQPYVFEHSDTSKFILIQELDHSIHAIHPTGKKLWSVVFSGRVVGSMQQLADRSIVLVTDRNRLYRFDTEGKPLKGFSVALPEEPTTTPTVAKRRGQDIIYVPTKTKVLAYDFEGRKVADWEEIEISGNIVGPVLAVGDQVAVGSSTGKIYYLDSNGQKSKEIALSGESEIQNPLGMYTDRNNTYQLLVTDTSRHFYKITADNPIVSYNLEAANASHIVDFRPITGGTIPEMITMNNSLLQVFDIQDSAKLIFEHNFTRDIRDRPQYFESPTDRGHHLLGVASRATRLIYLFTKNGAITEGFPVEGQPLFYYGRINYNSDTYLLVMRSDHKLYAFRHQK